MGKGFSHRQVRPAVSRTVQGPVADHGVDATLTSANERPWPAITSGASGDRRQICEARARRIRAGRARPIRQEAAALHARALEGMAVEIRCQTMAIVMDDDSIMVNSSDREERISDPNKGMGSRGAASPLAGLLARATGADTERVGRTPVAPCPAIWKFPRSVTWCSSTDFRVSRGRRFRKQVRRKGDSSFKYRGKGSMGTIGRTHAVAHSGGVKFTGFPAYVMWAFYSCAVPDRLGKSVGRLVRPGPLPLVHQEPCAPDYHP